MKWGSGNGEKRGDGKEGWKWGKGGWKTGRGLGLGLRMG